MAIHRRECLLDKSCMVHSHSGARGKMNGEDLYEQIRSDSQGTLLNQKSKLQKSIYNIPPLYRKKRK